MSPIELSNQVADLSNLTRDQKIVLLESLCCQLIAQQAEERRHPTALGSACVSVAQARVNAVLTDLETTPKPTL